MNIKVGQEIWKSNPMAHSVVGISYIIITSAANIAQLHLKLLTSLFHFFFFMAALLLKKKKKIKNVLSIYWSHNYTGQLLQHLQINPAWPYPLVLSTSSFFHVSNLFDLSLLRKGCPSSTHIMPVPNQLFLVNTEAKTVTVYLSLFCSIVTSPSSPCIPGPWIYFEANIPSVYAPQEFQLQLDFGLLPFNSEFLTLLHLYCLSFFLCLLYFLFVS